MFSSAVQCALTMKNQMFYVKDKGVALYRSMIITVFLPPDEDE